MEQFFSRQRRKSRTLVQMSNEEMERHCAISWYGDFELTDAVRPAHDSTIVPQRGYQYKQYRDQETGIQLPCLMVSESKAELLSLFRDLLETLFEQTSGVVDVVLESSHHRIDGQHDHYWVEHVDCVVLLSRLYDFEDLLLDDGCSGIAVLSRQPLGEVQFDEHKLLVVYGEYPKRLKRFEHVLRQHEVPYKPHLRFIIEDEHTHSTSDEFEEKFQRLKTVLGADDEEDWEL